MAQASPGVYALGRLANGSLFLISYAGRFEGISP